MQFSIKGTLSVIIRIIFLIIGCFIFVLSFFHGVDLNIMTLVGVSVLLVAVIPYSPNSKTITTWGLVIVTICLLFYSYFLNEMISTGIFDNDLGKIDYIDLLSYLLPVVILLYLIVNYVRQYKVIDSE